jgi:hypothetical protein
MLLFTAHCSFRVVHQNTVGWADSDSASTNIIIFLNESNVRLSEHVLFQFYCSKLYFYIVKIIQFGVGDDDKEVIAAVVVIGDDEEVAKQEVLERKAQVWPRSVL